VKEVDDLWHEVWERILLRHRVSRIYYRRKFYDYPLKPFQALDDRAHETVRIALSYLKWHVRPHPIEDNFEQWVMNRFGGRLFQHFFRTYTEKVWGIPCAEIRADWAEQRIKNLSLKEAVLSSFRGKSRSASLIEQFHYPRLGPGMMWEMFRDRVIARDDEVRLNCRAIRVLNRGDAIDAVEVRQGQKRTHHLHPERTRVHLVNAAGGPGARHGSACAQCCAKCREHLKYQTS
jgi:protoporphyrinogen oxidase